MRILSLIIVFSLLAYKITFCQVKDYPFSKIDVQDGLSNNQIVTIFKDHQGYLWFGTGAGLNRYDGYTIKAFRHDDANPASLSDNYIERVIEGPENKLYISSPSGGIDIYDPITQQFEEHTLALLQKQGLPKYGLVKIIKAKNEFYFIYRDSGIYKYQPGKAASLLLKSSSQNSEVVDAVLDTSGILWISYLNRLLQKIDLYGKQNSIIGTLQKQTPKDAFGYKLFVDSDNDIWLFAPGYASGLLKLNQRAGTLNRFCRDSGQARLSSNIVNDVIEDNKGMIWIATDQGGMVLLNKKLQQTRFLANSDEERSLSQNTITTLYLDNTGTVWAGTFKKGVCYYQENMLRFPLYRHQPGLPASLPYNDVNCFEEDKTGNIWLGTNGGGLILYNRASNTFNQFLHSGDNTNSISSNVVVTLTTDRQGKLWIGTYQGGLDCFDGRTFTHYRHKEADPASLADDKVYAIKEDNNGDLWIGTLMGGLDRFDRQKNKFYHNTTSQPNSLHSNYISSLCYDKDTNLWIGTAYGINVLRRSTGKYEYFTHENSNLGSNNLNMMQLDHMGNMWVATTNGLSVMQPGKDSFQVFRVIDGLASNTVSCVLEDNNHFLWVSTSGGITRITVEQGKEGIHIKCVNYDELDGLQGREFNGNAAFRTKTGELMFGGANGFNLFNPSNIKANGHIPPVVLTGMQLFNKEAPLPASILSNGELVLSYSENNFSLEFAALSFINARKNKYAYQLAGIDKGWVLTNGRNRLATYTNISPGEYIFRVKASNSDGVWNEEGITIRVIVKPPFWKTGFAYAIYLLVVLAALYMGRRRIINKARARFALAEERREALRLRELDRMKIKFITNLSHEFRTPLALILSPANKLVRTAVGPVQKHMGIMIERNAKRLLHLVNQLLDIRKMEVNELKIHMEEADIARFIRETVASFEDLSEERGISLTYNSDLQELYGLFDKDKVERIMFNLLSNAFKFTPAGGNIDVALNIVEKDDSSVLLELKVIDTGIGIPANMQGKIFDSFFQAELPGNMPVKGTGIGLAITKEFTEMHGGSISVESTLGKGSCFTILLPVTVVTKSVTAALGEEDFDAGANAQQVGDAGEAETTQADGPVYAQMQNGKKIKVLLAEDDEDFRFYLKDNLAPIFNIVEASNGREGWQKALSAHPDLIVSDVNMPVMDGLDFCRKIKGDDRLRHIPIILLTALTDEKDQLAALGAGANDFISKPFNVEILVSRIKNLLQYKGTVAQAFKRRIDIEPTEMEVDETEPDEDFMRQAAVILEKHIANPDFSIENWSREMHLSRTSLYKKIVACTGLTPIGFVRSFRLKRSAQLLESSRYNIAEVAYMVGFNNPKYFARYFKEEFGMLPSVYQAEKRKKQ